MNKPLRPASRRHGFTLIELLVVISIIAILAASSIPIIGAVKQNANSSVSLASLRQIGVALSTYAADEGHYPAIDGTPKIDGLDNWVAELVLALNPDDDIEELAISMPTDVFVSPGLAWEDGSGNGSFYEQSSLLNSYGASDGLAGMDADFELDTSIGRRPDSIDRKPETILMIETKQDGTNPFSIPYVSWGQASNDFGVKDAEEATSIDYRYRDRVNALMADMSAVNLGKSDDTKSIQIWNWTGTEYKDR